MSTPIVPQRTITIPLTKGYVAIIDEIDADLAQYKWHALTKVPYAARDKRTKTDRHYMYLHGVIGERMMGRPLLPNERVDHWDGNSLNNCRYNLRVCSHKDNIRNSKRSTKNTSGHKGVSWHKAAKKWSVQITADGILHHLGLFVNLEDACHAYEQAAKTYFGEFARIE